MNREKNKLLITGANGYIGSQLVKQALAHSYQVLALSRQRCGDTHSTWLKYDLRDKTLPPLPSDIGAVIHLAVDLKLTYDAVNQYEIDATELLLAFAEQQEARFIFISSIAASATASTSYGRTKWHIEQRVLARGGWVVRAGLVYGGPEKGLFGHLLGLLRKFPILPKFVPSPQVQPIHVDDFCEGLLRVINHSALNPNVFTLASETALSFNDFLSIISKNRLRKTTILLFTPIFIIKGCMVLARQLRPKPTALERLNALFNVPLKDTQPSLSMLQLQLRPLHSGVHCSGDGRRREILREGYAFMRYILRDLPHFSLLKKYLRAVESLYGGKPLYEIPGFILKYPMLLNLVDHGSMKTDNQAHFSQRLHAATMIAEASPQGANRFIHHGHTQNRSRIVLMVVFLMGYECLWRVLGFLFRPLLRKCLNKKYDAI